MADIIFGEPVPLEMDPVPFVEMADTISGEPVPMGVEMADTIFGEPVPLEIDPVPFVGGGRHTPFLESLFLWR